MPGATENTGSHQDQVRQTVTPVGDAWVICNSKSRPGLKYYFNTYTGHAAWNLSETEIEKAKKYTNGLPIAELEKCPEPLDPPMDPSQTAFSDLNNEQNINSQIPNQMSIFPINMLNGLPSVSGLNPNPWNTASNNAALAPQVIYFAIRPPMNFQGSQEYPQNSHANFQYNMYNRDSNMYNRDSNMYNRDSNMYNRDSNMYNREKRQHINWSRGRFASRNNVPHTSNRISNNPDLRQKLSRQRSKSQSFDPDLNEEYEFKDVHQDHAPVINIEEETPSKYDLSVLKQLKHPYSKADNWFIVVDTEIVVNNFQFLNRVTDPDQNCYLLVPDHVMTELKHLASSGSDVRIRRIYRFLSEQIDCELAFKGDDMTEMAANSIQKTFATCVDQAIQNNVILLSDDVKFNQYKMNKNNIHVLTMMEFNIIMLRGGPKKQPPTRIKLPIPDITIADTHNLDLKRSESNPSSRFTSKTYISKKERERTLSDTVPCTSNETRDDSVQASCSIKSQDEVNQIRKDPYETMACERHSEDSFFCGDGKLKKNEKKLCRTSTLKANVTENTPKRQYRWRKKRDGSNSKTNICAQTIDTKADNAEQYRWRKKRDGFNSKNNLSPQTIDPKLVNAEHNEASSMDICLNQEIYQNNILPGATFSSPQAPSLSSASSHWKRIERPNIVIEETSTSGIISNTNDSESVNSSSHSKDKKIVTFCEDVNFVMFQVTGPYMEDALKTRREEWVLRFVQIMEEILREKLRDDSSFDSKDNAAPWATDLPELARCIIKKYSDHFDVVDAANRLSFTLYRINDGKGNMTPNIKPAQYMDMYSYGVYLIESLKKVDNDCEDLKVADESLKKLLNDIHTANLDTSNNDPFADEPNESTLDETEHPYAEEGILQPSPEDDSKETSEKNHNEIEHSPIRYRLRSLKKKSQQVVPPENDRTFFFNLNLEKKLNSDKTSFVRVLDYQDTPKSTLNSYTGATTSAKVSMPPKIPRSPQTQGSPKTPQSPKTSQSPKTPESPKTTQSPKTPQLPRIPLRKQFQEGVAIQVQDNEQTTTNPFFATFVSNLSNSAPFKKTLYNNTLVHGKEQVDCEDKNDNAASTIAHIEEAVDDEFEEGEIRDDRDIPDTSALPDNFTVPYTLAVPDNSAVPNNPTALDKPAIPNTSNISLEHSEIENNPKFKCFIRDFVEEIRESFEAVHQLCSDFVEELKNSQESSSEMKTKLRVASSTMLNIYNSLNRIIDRELTTPDNNIIQLLKKGNLNDFVPNEDLRLEYMDVISKCKDQAYACYKTVTLFMKKADGG